MTLEEIKNKVNENIGNNVTIKYNLGRNKIEKYNVKIKNAYRNVFIVELNNKSEIKSFSYTDLFKLRYNVVIDFIYEIEVYFYHLAVVGH